MIRKKNKGGDGSNTPQQKGGRSMVSTWFTTLEFWVRLMEPEQTGTEDMPEVQALVVCIYFFWLNIHMVDGILAKH